MLAQLECENSEFTPDRVGISGDIGIPQFNPRFFPQANDPDYRQDDIRQINEYIELWIKREGLYKGDIDRILLHHHRPVSAKQGDLNFNGYIERIKNKCLTRFI